MPPGFCAMPEGESPSTPPWGPRVILVADPHRKLKRKRPKTYDHAVLKSLRKIWAILDCPCSLKLKAILPKIIPKLAELPMVSRPKMWRA